VSVGFAVGFCRLLDYKAFLNFNAAPFMPSGHSGIRSVMASGVSVDFGRSIMPQRTRVQL